MLTIHTQTSASDAKRYFDVSDYYSEGQETVGQWGGKLARELGLSGTVTKEAFDRLCDNLHPATCKPLTPRTNDERRVGYDFTFSAPKSFSILVGLASGYEKKALRTAFNAAVMETMQEAEADMQCRVRKDGMDVDRTTGNMVWAAFNHSTARPVEGQAPDPQEHAHIFVFNATKDQVEGRIKAGQFAGIKRDGEYFTAIFYSKLASRLEAMGFGIDRRGGKSWEISGVPQSAIDKFNKRSQEIEAEHQRRLREDPAYRAAYKHELAAKTRSKKQKELTPAELYRAWSAQLSDGERAALLKVYRREIAGGAEVTPTQAMTFALDHCSEQLSVMPERELKKVALLFGLGSVTPETLNREMLSPRHGLIVQEIDGRRMATSEKLQHEEDAIVGFAARGKGSVAAVGVPEGLKRGRLNDGQWAAVRGLLDSENRVNVLIGPAGAGKTDLLKSYAAAMAMAGENVAFLATSSDAVDVLHKDGFTDARTMAHFLLDTKLQTSLRDGYVVCDEASMLGHKDAKRFFELADKLNLKVTLVGDHLQHGSVPRGALLKILKNYAGLREFTLNQIMRQQHAGYLAAAESLSQGKTLEGFDALDSLGWVREVSDDKQRVEQLAADYVQAVKDKKSVLVVSPTHAEAAGITQEIRSQLRDAGLLGKEDRLFNRLVAVNASEAERGQATTYRPGDVIQFHQNAKGGYTKGDRITVTDPGQVPLTQAAKFSLYRPETIRLAEGDLIRFTGSVKTLDGKHTLKNGNARTIAGFDAKGNIRLDNAWLVAADAGHFRHGRVETSFGSQGKTVQRVLLGMSSASARAMNQENMYVSASRGKETMTLYTDSKKAVRSAIARSSQKLAALDLGRAKPAAKVNPFRKHWERLKRHLEHRRRIGYFDGLRPSWGSAQRQPDRQRLAGQSKSHIERLGRQEREYGHER